MAIFLIALVVGFLNFIAISLVMYALSKRRVNLERRLRTPKQEADKPSKVAQAVRRLEEIARPVGEMLPRSPEEMSRQERKLVHAGYRRKDAVYLFYACQISIAMLLALILLATGFWQEQFIISVLMSLIGGAAIPDIWLSHAINKRRLRIQFGLADAMDLTLVSVEAGLGLDQALLRVGNEIKVAYPDLAEELHLRNIEVNMGRPRSEALRNLYERTGVEDLKQLVAILIQTDRFGTSIGSALRTFSDFMRTKRRQRAEEQAAKLSTKMIVPMVLFIFPSVYVVILGPAFIKIMSDLLPALAGQK